VQRDIPGADDRQGLRRAGGSLVDGWKRDSRGRECDGGGRGDACAVEDQSLRGSGGVVGNLKVCGECADGCRIEGNGNGTVGVGRKCCGASVRLGKTGGIGSGNRNGIDGEQLIPNINEGKDLGRAAEAGGGSEVRGGGRKNGGGGAANGLHGIACDSQSLTAHGNSRAEWGSEDFCEVASLLVHEIGVHPAGRR